MDTLIQLMLGHVTRKVKGWVKICASHFINNLVCLQKLLDYYTYGPGMKLDDGRVFADFIANILNKKDIIMKSDGSAIRAFCYLSDAVSGFFTVLLNGENGSVYNVGNDKGVVSILNLAERLV